MLMDDALADADFATALDALCNSLAPREADEVRVAITAVVARLIEARLLGDEVLRQVARLPQVYVGRARDIVETRVRHLGLDGCVDGADVRYLARLLTAGGPGSTYDTSVGADLVSALFRQVSTSGAVELRCGVCGYHFRRDDLSIERLELAQQFEFEFAEVVDPRRAQDRLKPAFETGLHIDHVVPRVGWGPTQVANLAVLCEFCNTGKLAFRRGLENVSGFGAGGAPALDALPTLWSIRQTVVGALMTRRSCEDCGRGPTEVELTASRLREWFVPWTLEVRCYDCVDMV